MRLSARRFVRAFAFAIIGLYLLVMGLLGFAYWEARWDPAVRRAEVALPDWPKGAPPLTVLLVSDTHVGGPDMPPERLARIVDRLNALKPDLVLLGGDYISHKPISSRVYTPDQIIAPLTRFRAPLGTLAVLGNHDHGEGGTRIADALARAGIPALSNAAVRRGALIVGAVDDGFSSHADLPRTQRAMDALGPGPRILLTHAPDIARRLPFRVDAVLAGHTHCGQVVLPFYGSIARDNDRFRWLPCGRIDIKGTPLFVGAGLGTSGLPLRFGARPDVWLIRFGPGH